MRGFKVHELSVGENGPVDSEFYQQNVEEWQHIVNLFGDNGIVMLNRDLARLDTKAAKLGTEEAAAQVRALSSFILGVM